ncbi:LLM class flavin-dependent oxidoreductase [Litoribacter populi]|uniref:LLM class flavin-dependent oxidoreductase n=1 Tax=Litoribacter populi TaxID=2598460 RepID=UPI00117C6BAB|nr:LLM class flavin-dependent oxidoreductase [Litoribacter populi]
MKNIGLLDFGYFDPDENTSVDLINYTVKLVKNLEDFGFSRYWMAEHYNDFCSWTNPEVLLTILAGTTDKIKLGAAGILIYYHSPFRVASTFKMLSSLFPGRIDLGLARGGVDPHMLNHLLGKEGMSYDSRVENEKLIYDYLYNHNIYDANGNMVPIPPYGGALPSTWSLGTSLSSAFNSIKLNTNFSLSLFHEKKNISEYQNIWESFLEERDKSFNKKNLECNIAIQYSSISDPKVLKQMAFKNNISINDSNSVKIIGEPSFCKDRIQQFFELFNTNEIIIHDLSRSIEQRNQTIESLSELINVEI